MAYAVSTEYLKRSRPFEADGVEGADDHRGGKRAFRATSVQSEIDLNSDRTSYFLSDTTASVSVNQNDDDDDCSMLDYSIDSEALKQPEAKQLSISQREICFGTIVDVKAALLSDNESHDGRSCTLSVLPDGVHHLVIAIHNDRYCLQSNDSRDVAVVHSRTAVALETLRDLPSIRLEAVLLGGGVNTPIQQYRKGKWTVFPISINIYGSEKVAEDVGKRLSKARAYLQHPTTLNEIVPYKNPHYYDIPGLAKAETHYISHFSEREEQQAPVLDMTKIFEEVAHSRKLPSQEADWHITTPLLEHQKEALHFITQRESLSTDETFSLWTAQNNDDNRSCYQHTILGSRRLKKPEPSRGGILADDMGLGKTLTMISAITMSLNEARTFIGSRYDMQTGSGPPNARRASSTLVIAPSSVLLDAWKDEFQKHVRPGQLRIYKYHGNGRKVDIDSLVEYDVVLTTYATIALEVAKRSSLFQKIRWFRVVLDEAHAVRHQSTQQFRAVHSLCAERRWCLTGTPIQNRMEDLGSLIRFLRIDPFDSNTTFRTHISEPLLTDAKNGDQNLRLLLKSMCLRRTRILLDLPNTADQIIPLSFSKEERSTYSQTIEDTKRKIDDCVSSRSISKAYGGIFQAILRLRLICNNGTYQLANSRSKLQDDCAEDRYVEDGKLACQFCSCEISVSDGLTDSSPGASPRNDLQMLCPACLSSNDIDKTGYQREPMKQWATSSQHVPHNDITENSSHPQESVYQGSSTTPRPNLLANGHSTKLYALISNLEGNMLGNKSIVFSCWKRTLALVGLLLENASIQYLRIDGATTTIERNGIIKRFQEHPDSNLLLMTTGTGAVGLNLTAANRVYLLEPQWNPAIEAQAIGRALRLGQKRTVTIIRYVMEKTIEESIQSRQIMKLQLAELTLEKKDGNEQPMLQRLKDLRSLLHT
ncbi:SNF2 family N-terminal domain-containing protein [Usnea florida]